MEDFTRFYQKSETVGSYDRIRLKGFKQGINREIELIVLSKMVPKGAILEVGPGTGYITQILVKKGKVIAVEPSQEMIKEAKSRAPGAKYINKGLFQYKSKSKFDSIVTIRVLGHFSPLELDHALNHISNLIKPSGRIIFSIENSSFVRRFIRAFKKKRVETYQFSKSQILALLNRNGLKAERIVPTDHFWILSPLYILNKLFLGRLRRVIINAEINLLSVPYCNVNWIIICRKK